MLEKMLLNTKIPPFLPERAWEGGQAACGAGIVFNRSNCFFIRSGFKVKQKIKQSENELEDFFNFCHGIIIIYRVDNSTIACIVFSICTRLRR